MIVAGDLFYKVIPIIPVWQTSIKTDCKIANSLLHELNWQVSFFFFKLELLLL